MSGTFETEEATCQLCPKCASGCMTLLEYCEGPEHDEPGCFHKFSRQHLTRYCATCGYGAIELCADAGKRNG